MIFISRSFKMGSAIALVVSIACVTLVAQKRKVAPAGPAKAIELKAPLPDLKFNLLAAESLCTTNGLANVEVIVTVINAGKGVADFSKVPFQTVMAVDSWAAVDPDGKVTPAFGNVILPKVGGTIVLGPGQEWTRTLEILSLPKLKNGTKVPSKYSFAIKVDPSNGIAESDEGNNLGGVNEPDPCFKK